MAIRRVQGTKPWRALRYGRNVRSLVSLVPVVSALSLLGCTGDTTAPRQQLLGGTNGFWSQTLNVHSVTMSTVAPYDTIRIVVTPRDITGAPLTGPVLDSVVTVYQNTNPRDTSVTVTSDGLMQAHGPKDGIRIVVRTTLQGITRADTLQVNVTSVASPPQFTTLAVQVTPDTLPVATLGGDGFSIISAQVLDALGNPIPHVDVKFWLRDPALFDLFSFGGGDGELDPKFNVHPKTTMLVAEATVYGVTKLDSVPVTLAPPSFVTISAVFTTPRTSTTPIGSFVPSVDTTKIFDDPILGLGVTVGFGNPASNPGPIDVVFDDSAAAQSSVLNACGLPPTGNIPAFIGDPTGTCGQVINGRRWRFFTTPGTYHYHSTLYGTSGTIVVLP